MNNGRTKSGEWLELAVEVDREAVEPVSEVFARYGFNEGVVIEEPFSQDPDGDHLAVDLTRPVTVRTYLPRQDASLEIIGQIRHALWHLGQLRHVGELQVTVRHEEDWADAWKEHYRPIRAGRRVVVRPPWFAYEPAAGDVVVVLDPGMAFGTGTHQTTRLALILMEDELRPGMDVLDVGTGSGILAIAAALLGARSVRAVDIEPVAVRRAAENVRLNNLTGIVQVAVGSVDQDEVATAYELVVANIIARVLIDLAPGLAASVRPGGRLVLSGIIEPKEESVVAAFADVGLRRIRREVMDDWVAHVWERPGYA
ncbi:MAG: 50S ribosomal protein L11 methyltransferase [Chloroflexota bacterium]